MRATYKDFVQLINKNSLLDLRELRRRGEEEFQGDRRIVHSGMSKGRSYVEGREFVEHGVHVEYHFIARCYTEEIERFLRKIKDGSMKTPDVFIMNSCLWDISRWGPHGVDAYKENMTKLMHLLKECLPSQTLFIWTTTLPVSSLIRGGLLIKQIDFLQDMLRFEVMEANIFCRQLIVSHGYDVLDTHYYLRMQVHRRFPDGLHYAPLPVRLITNLILTHVCLSWDIPLPGRAKGVALERVINHCTLQASSRANDVVLPTVPDCLNVNGNQADNNETEAQPVPRRNVARPHMKRRGTKRNGAWVPPPRNNVQVQAWDTNNQNWDAAPAEGPQSWETESGMCPAAPRNEPPWANPQPAPAPARLPPWKQRQLERNQNQNQIQNFWQDCTGEDDTAQQADWNGDYEYNEQYQQSSYADFDRVGGPVRQNQKFNNNRTRPY
ncbi:PC-esterase domain-containing protein 1A-like isoform X2 [Planococcus citri]